jgi:hypothetical protein
MRSTVAASVTPALHPFGWRPGLERDGRPTTDQGNSAEGDQRLDQLGGGAHPGLWQRHRGSGIRMSRPSGECVMTAYHVGSVHKPAPAPADERLTTTPDI